MSADFDVLNAMNGTLADGAPRPWAWVRCRARTVLGDVLKKKPFSRKIDGNNVAATTSELDHVICTAEQVSWRYVASDATVWDLKDFMITLIEEMIEDRGTDQVAALRAKASHLRPYPEDFIGKGDFE